MSKLEIEKLKFDVKMAWWHGAVFGIFLGLLIGQFIWK